MRIDRRALKSAAKEKMREARPSHLWVTLFFMVLTTGISLLFQFIVNNPLRYVQSVADAVQAGYSMEDILTAAVAAQPGMPAVMTLVQILLYLYSGIVTFGYLFYCLKRARRESAGVGDVISAFAQLGRVIPLNLILLGFTIVWSLAVCVPLAVLLLAAGLLLGQSLAINVVVLLLSLAASLLLALLLNRYALSSYLLMDSPEMGAMEAVRQSRRMMGARTGELLRLQLSFLGWVALLMVIALAAFVGASILIGMLIGAALGMAGITAAVIGTYIVTLLAVLPLILWYTSYYQGVMAEYYCAVLAEEPVSSARPLPGSHDLF